MPEVRGLPLLSGPPPPMESGDANCTDYQALMPRAGQGSGYDPMNVCGFCIDFLNVTAAGKGILRTLPLSKLKKYLEAYNIEIGRVVEKDDLIDAILRARDYYRNYSVPDKSTSHTRSRFFGRPSGHRSTSSAHPPPPPPRPQSNTHPRNFPRPDLEPDPLPHQTYTPPPGPPPAQHQSRPSYPPPPPVPPRPQQHFTADQYYHQQSHQHANYQHQRSHSQTFHHTPPHYPPPTPQATRPTGYPQYQRPSASRSSENLNAPRTEQQTPPRQRAASAAPPPAVPPPTLDQLLEMPEEALKSLSIGALKSVLFTYHVNAGLILEKGDLVAKVKVLVEDERRERERQRLQAEAEEMEAAERTREAREQAERQQHGVAEMETPSTAEVGDIPQDSERDPSQATEPSAPPPPPKTPPKPRGTAMDLERTGLCVICQDDEANIAIVDCGHLAMCRGCSDLIMASSFEMLALKRTILLLNPEHLSARGFRSGFRPTLRFSPLAWDTRQRRRFPNSWFNRTPRKLSIMLTKLSFENVTVDDLMRVEVCPYGSLKFHEEILSKLAQRTTEDCAKFKQEIDHLVEQFTERYRYANQGSPLTCSLDIYQVLLAVAKITDRSDDTAYVTVVPHMDFAKRRNIYENRESGVKLELGGLADFGLVEYNDSRLRGIPATSF
ncbi:hypothetical protein H0H93_014986 [Arthromyces matolae]|nr:hypothetical protein H0H93_014986 [Arthromyces matolae]